MGLPPSGALNYIYNAGTNGDEQKQPDHQPWNEGENPKPAQGPNGEEHSEGNEE